MRKHRCELCNYIFECYLCGINDTHILHSGIRINKNIPIFICPFCIHEREMLYSMTYSQAGKHGTIIRLYDHMSGRLMHIFNTTSRKRINLPRYYKNTDDLMTEIRKLGWTRDF